MQFFLPNPFEVFGVLWESVWGFGVALLGFWGNDPQVLVCLWTSWVWVGGVGFGMFQ